MAEYTQDDFLKEAQAIDGMLHTDGWKLVDKMAQDEINEAYERLATVEDSKVNAEDRALIKAIRKVLGFPREIASRGLELQKKLEQERLEQKDNSLSTETPAV